MNDEGRPLERPRHERHQSPGYQARRRPPELHIAVQLEEMPRLWLVADTFEDEMRLRQWLAHQSTRRRLMDALLDAFEEAA